MTSVLWILVGAVVLLLLMMVHLLQRVAVLEARQEELMKMNAALLQAIAQQLPRIIAT
jgi:hypothetical protein